MHRRLLAEGMVSPADVEMLIVTDDPAHAVEVVNECYVRRCASLTSEPAKADAQ